MVNGPSAKPVKDVAKVLAVVTAVLLLLVAASILAAVAWYHDDQCVIAGWQCGVGGLGLLGFTVLGPLAVVSALLTLLAWGAYFLRRRGR
jgi:hypothetical protein